MRLDTTIPSENLRAVRLKDYIAVLDRMTADTCQKLTELESGILRERERLRLEHSNFSDIRLSRFDLSMAGRCQNLRATLEAIEREGVRAQKELGVVLQANKP